MSVMLTLPGYRVISEIFEGRHSLVYHARREKDNLPVVLKLLKKD